MRIFPAFLVAQLVLVSIDLIPALLKSTFISLLARTRTATVSISGDINL